MIFLAVVKRLRKIVFNLHLLLKWNEVYERYKTRIFEVSCRIYAIMEREISADSLLFPPFYFNVSAIRKIQITLFLPDEFENVARHECSATIGFVAFAF